MNAGLREELVSGLCTDVVSGERNRIMDEMRVKADQDSRKDRCPDR